MLFSEQVNRIRDLTAFIPTIARDRIGSHGSGVKRKLPNMQDETQGRRNALQLEQLP